MRKTLVLSTLLFVACTATAHQVTYPAVPPSPFVLPPPTFWHASYAGGHVSPDPNGDAVLLLTDVVFNPAAGRYCQDFNNDGVCGSPDPLNPGQYLEPLLPFCGSIIINSPVVLGSKSPAQWAMGGNWDPTMSVHVFPFFPPVPGGCGGPYDGAYVGTLDHL